MKQSITVCVIGAGPAGLSASFALKEQMNRAGVSFVRVLLLDSNPEPGKKLLLTGNGRCNFSHKDISHNDYRSDSFKEEELSGFVRDFLKPTDELLALLCCKESDNPVQSFFESIGIFSHERDGGLYPAGNQASVVACKMTAASRNAGVEILSNCKCAKVVSNDNGYVLSLEHPDPKGANCNITSLTADYLILTAGGCAYPKTGSDGSGFMIAKALGLAIRPWHPGLAALMMDTGQKRLAEIGKLWAGVRSNASVSIYFEKQDKSFELLATDRGEIQFTDYGISGIPVFNVSRYVSKIIPMRSKKTVVSKIALPSFENRVKACIDLCPELSEEELLGHMKVICQNSLLALSTASECLSGLLNEKLAQVVTSAVHCENVPAGDLSEEDLKKLVCTMKDFRVDICGTRGYDTAQICAGGIDLNQVDPRTMYVKDGLFAAGEVLDLDAACGGYNIHACILGGLKAGLGSAERILNDYSESDKNTNNSGR